MAPQTTKSHEITVKRDGFTLTALGCGNLGMAIVAGILSDLKDKSESAHTKQEPFKLTRVIACVTRPASAERVKDGLSHLTSSLTVLQNDNLKGVQDADVVLLGCKPYHLNTVLGQSGIKEALAGKTLISILAGVPASQIQATLYGATEKQSESAEKECQIVCAMPNTSALIRQSMTVIAKSDPPLPSDIHELVTWMFEKVGRVVSLPPHLMYAATALCASGPANCVLVMEAMADGALAMGIPRAEAQIMAAQAMYGAAGLVLNGEHPAIVREKICTPGGCTIGGLLVLEEGGVRGVVSRSVREATEVASQLGKGVQNVNGTRHQRAL